MINNSWHFISITNRKKV